MNQEVNFLDRNHFEKRIAIELVSLKEIKSRKTDFLPFWYQTKHKMKDTEIYLRNEEKESYKITLWQMNTKETINGEIYPTINCHLINLLFCPLVLSWTCILPTLSSFFIRSKSRTDSRTKGMTDRERRTRKWVRTDTRLETTEEKGRKWRRKNKTTLTDESQQFPEEDERRSLFRGLFKGLFRGLFRSLFSCRQQDEGNGHQNENKDIIRSKENKINSFDSHVTFLNLVLHYSPVLIYGSKEASGIFNDCTSCMFFHVLCPMTSM